MNLYIIGAIGIVIFLLVLVIIIFAAYSTDLANALAHREGYTEGYRASSDNYLDRLVAYQAVAKKPTEPVTLAKNCCTCHQCRRIKKAE